MNRLLSEIEKSTGMGRIGKSLSLTFIMIIGLTIIGTVSAQSIPNPSVPEFSLEYVNTSYFSSPITTTDPYTGQTQSYNNSITERGIIVTIKNQPFTQPLDNNGLLEVNQSCLFYLFQWKGHYSTTWTNSSQNSLYQDSNTSYTVLRIPLNGNNDYRFSSPIELEGITEGGKLDFQIQAFIGYYKYIPTPTQLNPFYPTSTAVFVGQSSGWSQTLTIDIINGSTTTSIGMDSVSGQLSNPTPTPSVPESSWLMIPPLFISTFFMVVLFRKRKLTDTHD